MVHNATDWGLGRAQTQPHLTFLQLRILCGSAGGLHADLGLQPGAASTPLYIVLIGSSNFFVAVLCQ